MITATDGDPRVDLYVYYRARVENAVQVQLAVGTMQQRLRADGKTLASLKRRPEPKDGFHTWMEVYPAAVPGFAQALDAAVAESGLSALIDGPRHTETFLDIDSCA